MASWIKNMKDGSRRLKDEFVRTLGAGCEGSIDPVLDYRTQRFHRYNESLEKLAKAMAHYSDVEQAYSHASVHLMHSFSEFFETQLQDYSPEETDYTNAKSLAQSALRLEEIHQSLQANVYSSARAMQTERVARSIQELRKNNAALQKQIQTLKQRLVDYDSVRRSAEAQKRGTPDFERMQQRQQVAEAGLVTLTTDINVELNAIESRRGVDMKNELLTVVACQLFTHSRAQEHVQQLLPLLPGVAKPLLQIVEYARARPRVNPGTVAASEPGGVGVIAYTGAESRDMIDRPLQYHIKTDAAAKPGAEQLLASVHPLESLQFAELHFAEKLALATYGSGCAR